MGVFQVLLALCHEIKTLLKVQHDFAKTGFKYKI